jgi:hypothetical protein
MKKSAQANEVAVLGSLTAAVMRQRKYNFEKIEARKKRMAPGQTEFRMVY